MGCYSEQPAGYQLSPRLERTTPGDRHHERSDLYSCPDASGCSIISGRVTNATCDPIGNVNVNANSDNFNTQTSTGGDGTTPHRLTGHSYQISFQDNSSTYVDGCYASATSARATATPVRQ